MRLFILFSLSFFVVQCTTTPERAGRTTDVGIWQGKVQMTNTKTNNKKWANVTWASDSSENRMRVDVYAVFDVPVATFIKKGEETHLWMFMENKYYYSEKGEKLFKHLTKLTLDPNVFYSLLGDPKPPGLQWQCQDKKGIYYCLSKELKTKMQVVHEDQDKRTIKVLRGSKALRLRLLRSKVEVKDQHFKLLSTSQFKTIKI